jgi:hypothetical protein
MVATRAAEMYPQSWEGILLTSGVVAGWSVRWKAGTPPMPSRRRSSSIWRRWLDGAPDGMIRG